MRLAVALLCVAAPAQADCPTGEDLAGKGLRLSGAGTVETYRHRVGDIVEILATYSDQSPWHLNARYGLYPVEGRDFYGSGDELVTRYTPSLPLDSLPEPVPGGNVEVTMHAVSAFELSTEEGVTEQTEVLTYRFEAPVTLRLAGCSYQAVPVVEARDGEAWEGYRSHYVADFGFTFRTGPLAEDGAPTMAFYDTMEVVE